LLRSAHPFFKNGQSPDEKDSPSSGLFRVKVYNADKGTSVHGMAQRNGTGMFPREVVQKPLPPPVGGFCQGACQWHAALNRYPVPHWVDQQVYLHPYPKELMLRNHV